MAKIWTFLLLLTVSTLFIHVPHKGEIHFILNDAVKLSYNQFVWMSVTYLTPIALISIILDEARDNKNLIRVFLFINIIDFLSFIIAYDDPLKHYVLTFNILKLLIFLTAIVIDKWKHLKRELSALRSFLIILMREFRNMITK